MTEPKPILEDNLENEISEVSSLRAESLVRRREQATRIEGRFPSPDSCPPTFRSPGSTRRSGSPEAFPEPAPSVPRTAPGIR